MPWPADRVIHLVHGLLLPHRERAPLWGTVYLGGCHHAAYNVSISHTVRAMQAATPMVAPGSRVFSYVRFSTDAHTARGDSLRRQTALAQAWFETHGVALDPRFVW